MHYIIQCTTKYKIVIVIAKRNVLCSSIGSKTVMSNTVADGCRCFFLSVHKTFVTQYSSTTLAFNKFHAETIVSRRCRMRLSGLMKPT